MKSKRSGSQIQHTKLRLKRLRDAGVDVRGMTNHQLRMLYYAKFGAMLNLESCSDILAENWEEIKATGCCHLETIKMPADIVAPVVHLNGTSKTALMRQLLEARTGIERALELLAETAPNGRDFPGNSARLLPIATAQFHARVGHLEAVNAELQELLNRVDSQG